MRILRIFLVLLVLAVVANAGTITVIFDSAVQGGISGQVLRFFGTIYNTGPGAVYLNSDSFRFGLGMGSYTVADYIYPDLPLLLPGNSSSGDIELFDATLRNPVMVPPGLYTATYMLLGGASGATQERLAVTDFTIGIESPTPEPGTLVLFGSALAAMAALRLRKTRRNR